MDLIMSREMVRQHEYVGQRAIASAIHAAVAAGLLLRAAAMVGLWRPRLLRPSAK
jgi:hypothetical protein